MCKPDRFTHPYQPLAKLPFFDYSNVDHDELKNAVTPTAQNARLSTRMNLLQRSTGSPASRLSRRRQAAYWEKRMSTPKRSPIPVRRTSASSWSIFRVHLLSTAPGRGRMRSSFRSITHAMTTMTRIWKQRQISMRQSQRRVCPISKRERRLPVCHRLPTAAG